MGCCPNRPTGREFDPDREAPCEADVARFSAGYDDDEGWYDDEAFERCDGRAASRSARKGMIAFVAVLALIAFVLVFIVR